MMHKLMLEQLVCQDCRRSGGRSPGGAGGGQGEEDQAWYCER